MSLALIRVCRAILREHFGPLVEKVGVLLLQRGRSNLPSIVRATEMPQKQIKECLFVLIHHNIVTYAETPEGTKMTVYYKADARSIICRDRFSPYLNSVKERLGEEAEKVFREVLRQGRANYPLLVKQLRPWQMTRDQLADVFSNLCESHFIVECIKEDSISTDDKRMKEEAEEVAKRGGLPLTATELTKLRRQLASKRDAAYDEAVETGQKRKIVRDIDEVANKKFAVEEESRTIDDTKFYRANFDRIHIQLRNEAVAQIAEHRINKGAGEVMRKLLGAADYKMRHCKMEEKSEPVSQMTLSSLLNPRIPLEVDGHSVNAAVDYLEELIRDDTRLVSKESEGGGGQYSVNLRKAGTELRTRLLVSIVQEKFGDTARRIWRILLMMNKLNETQIAKLALVPVKAARHCLYAMMNAGLAFIQDVPKTLDHSAARTFFLWYVSIPRSTSILMQNAYRTLGNIKQRRFREVGARAILIEKMQRSDVKEGRVQLSEGDQRAAQQLDQVVVQLLVTESRMAQLLMTLEEF